MTANNINTARALRELFPTDKWLSTLMGFGSRLQLPKPILYPILKQYVEHYQIDLREVSKPLADFRTFEEFFTRPIDLSLRPIDPSPKAIISPVDGQLSQFGSILSGRMLQAKGKDFALQDLIGPEIAPQFSEGSFATLYLSPKDYHRFHCPFAGILRSGHYFPGQLNPVNAWGVNNVKNLFCKNERFLLSIETPFGLMGMLAIGALVVGRIHLNFHKEPFYIGKNLWEPPFSLAKGEELGCFQLGSTVILLFPKNKVNWELTEDQPLRLGQRLGSWLV